MRNVKSELTGVSRRLHPTIAEYSFSSAWGALSRPYVAVRSQSLKDNEIIQTIRPHKMKLEFNNKENWKAHR